MEQVTLNNDVKMPALGCGVYQVDPAECERCVAEAIEVGYRSIDTAQAYRNEEGVGNAVEKSGVPRSELFITTKVWISNAGYEKATSSITCQHLDVIDVPAIRALVDRSFETFGRIDIIVSNAGYGLFGAAEKRVRRAHWRSDTRPK